MEVEGWRQRWRGGRRWWPWPNHGGGAAMVTSCGGGRRGQRRRREVESQIGDWGVAAGAAGGGETRGS